jgi:hypothetical protein
LKGKVTQIRKGMMSQRQRSPPSHMAITEVPMVLIQSTGREI